MEIGTEISKNIRSSITTRLVELGAYVDNELAEYIMVMVENKKRKEQMIEDLSLFLGKNTEAFTDWLLKILHKLQMENEEPETSEKAKQSLTSNSATNTVKLIKTTKNTDISESEDDFIEEICDDCGDNNFVNIVKPGIIIPTIAQPKMPPVIIRPIVESAVKLPMSTAKIEPLSRKRRIPGSIVGPPVQEKKDVYDPYNPTYVSVASVVKVTERKSSVPPEIEANKSLLMKAVKAAQKSVKEAVHKPGQVRIEPFRQGPFELFTRHYQDKQTFQKQVLRRVDHKDNVLTTVHSERPQLFDRRSSNDGINDEKAIVLTPSLRNSNNKYLVEDDTDYLELEVDPQESRLIEYSDTLSDDFTKKYIFKSDLSSDQREVIMTRRIVQEDSKVPSPAPANRKLIVTLDGADDFVKQKPTLNQSQDSKLSSSSHQISNKVATAKSININLHDSDEMKYSNNINIAMKYTADNNRRNYEDVGPPAKKKKISDHCRFWPGCKNAESCPFHHPSTQCRTFPNCKFGDRCLYIHPNCKFDAKCAKKDCPYIHTYKRTMVAASPVMPSIVIKQSLQQVVCRFFPGCKNMNCQFYHPKSCHFGLSCSRSDCSFFHPLPPSHKLKWVCHRQTYK